MRESVDFPDMRVRVVEDVAEDPLGKAEGQACQKGGRSQNLPGMISQD